jgi:hypothetical protein
VTGAGKTLSRASSASSMAALSGPIWTIFDPLKKTGLKSAQNMLD